MKKRSIIFLVFLTLIIQSATTAQNTLQKKQIKVANDFVEAYNQQNYSKMTKTFFLAGRLLPIKKKLRERLEPQFNRYGKASVGNIQYPDHKKVIVELSYEKNTDDKELLVFYYNKRNKLAGLNFKNPDFVYPKQLEVDNIKKNDVQHIHKMDSLMAVKSRNGFNGSVLVIDNGHEIYKKSFGYADFDRKTLLDNNSVFELASCSKQFTAMAIMQLAEQGKLSYSDTIQKYIPGLPYKNITIENLLTHTLCLPD